jgi:hypothetical protein
MIVSRRANVVIQEEPQKYGARGRKVVSRFPFRNSSRKIANISAVISAPTPTLVLTAFPITQHSGAFGLRSFSLFEFEQVKSYTRQGPPRSTSICHPEQSECRAQRHSLCRRISTLCKRIQRQAGFLTPYRNDRRVPIYFTNTSATFSPKSQDSTVATERYSYDL